MNQLFRSIVTISLLLLGWSSVNADYLAPDLRAEVDRLVQEIDAKPTNESNVRQRADVLWRWANQWALDGRFVPVNLTQVIASVLGYELPTRRVQHQRIEGYIRTLAFSDKDPNVLGNLQAFGGPFEAAAYGTLTQTFTVGTANVKQGGGILVARHFMGGYSYQTGDPTAENYVSIRSSNADVAFEIDAVQLAGMHGGFRGAAGALVFRITEGKLTQGDQVSVIYGDTATGGPGMRMPQIGSDFLVFPIYVAFDAGDHYIPLPLQPVSVVGSTLAGVHGFAPSIVATGEPFEISIRARDRFFNRPTEPSPPWRVKLNEVEVARTQPSVSAITKVRLEQGLSEAGVYQLTIESTDGAISGYGNAILVEDEPSHFIYWGDTHGHSGFAEGLGTPDRFMRWAKNDAALDYVTHSEHDIWMDDAEWQVLIDNVERFSDANFIAFLGYEWTRSKFLGGHHNVIFRTAQGRERIGAQFYGTLSKLYHGLHEKHDANDVVVIPHAHQPGNYRFSDPDLEHLVEIMSQHGSFEWFGQKYLQHGHEVGFTAASDNHLSQPGYTAPTPGGLSQRGGLGALIATEKTRDSLFDAMKNINAYATTGDRIILDFTLNDTPMGKRIPFTEQRELRGRVIAAWPIAAIAIVKNDGVIWSRDYLAAEGSAPVSEGKFKVSFSSDSTPHHEHDNPRGWKNWIGTLTIEGATLLAAEPMDFANRQAQQFAINDDGTISFSTQTRGDESSFDLTLADIGPNSTLTFQLSAGREYGGGPPSYREHQTFPATTVKMALQGQAGEAVEQTISMPDYDDTIRVRRIVREGSRDRTFELSDTGTQQGDYYFVRATLANDAVAWSSPIWVGGYKTL